MIISSRSVAGSFLSTSYSPVALNCMPARSSVVLDACQLVISGWYPSVVSSRLVSDMLPPVISCQIMLLVSAVPVHVFQISSLTWHQLAPSSRLLSVSFQVVSVQLPLSDRPPFRTDSVPRRTCSPGAWPIRLGLLRSVGLCECAAWFSLSDTVVPYQLIFASWYISVRWIYAFYKAVAWL